MPPTQIDIYVDSIVAVLSTTTALGDLQDAGDRDVINRVMTGSVTVIDSADDVINNPSVRLVDSIIREAIPFKASDIHIEPFERTVKVRYRIDGDLQLRVEFPIESYSAICARLKIMSGINIAERRIPQDGRISMAINGTEYDFRVATLPTVYGEKFVIRILDKTSFNFTRTDLGFTADENLVIDKILAHSYGIVLLTGPTGCGKSTTLYSFLKEINRPTVNVITVEDPVEYTMNGINQVQVNPKADLTFANALRSILRQDPDIIMVGEIRDALVGVIAQRLVKRLCPACKKRGKTNEAEMKLLGLDEPVSVFRAQGCQFCGHTGYRGRVAVHEIMYMSERLRSAVTQGRTIDELREIAKEEGMVNLWDSCKKLVMKGVTDISELMSLYDD